MPDYKFTTTRDNNNEKFETGLFNSDGKTEIIASTPVVGEGKDTGVNANTQTTDAAITPGSKTLSRSSSEKPEVNLQSQIDEINKELTTLKSDLQEKSQNATNKSTELEKYDSKEPEDDLQNQIVELKTLKEELNILKDDLQREFNNTTKNSEDLQELYDGLIEKLEDHTNTTTELLNKSVSKIENDSKDFIVEKLNEINDRSNNTLKEKDQEIKNLQEEVKKLWEEIAKLKGRIPLKIFDCESKSIDSKSYAKETPITIFDCENKKDPQLIKIFDCKSDAVVAAEEVVDTRSGSDMNRRVGSSNIVDRIVDNGSISANISEKVVDSPKTINAFTCDSSDPKTINAFTCDSNVEKPTTPSQAINAFTCANDNKETSDYELYSIIFLKNKHHYVSANLVKDKEGKETWIITNSRRNDPNTNYIDDMPSKKELFTTMNNKSYIPVAAFYTNKGLKKKEDNGKIYNNGNNACYMVSVLQTLYHSNAFQELLNNIESEGIDLLIDKYQEYDGGGINYETVKTKWKEKFDNDKKSHILALIKHFQEKFMLTANKEGNISEDEGKKSFDENSYNNHLKYLFNILKVEDDDNNIKKRLEYKKSYGDFHNIFALIDMIEKYFNDLINYKAIDELNDIKQNDSKPIQVFDTSTYIYSGENTIQAQDIPQNLPKDEQTKDGNITAFACAEPKITAFDCEKKGEIPTVQSSQIPSLSFVQQSAQPSAQAATNLVIKTDIAKEKPVIKAFECAKDKPVIKAFECATTTSDIKKPAEEKPVIKAFECAEDKPVIKAFECAEDKPVIKAFECAEEKPVIKAFECAKDVASPEDIQVEEVDETPLIEQIVKKISRVARSDRLEQIRKLIGLMNPRYIVDMNKSNRSNNTVAFFRNNKSSFANNNGDNAFLSLYSIETEDYSLPIPNGTYRLRNRIVKNMESMGLNEKEKSEKNKHGELIYSEKYLDKHKLRANKIDNLIYVSKEDISNQLTAFKSDQLTFLNKYLENKTITPIELIENAKRYVDEKTDEDNLIAWVENKINKINVNRDDANLYHDIQKLVLTMFACEPTLEEEIKKLEEKIINNSDPDPQLKEELNILKQKHEDALKKLEAERTYIKEGNAIKLKERLTLLKNQAQRLKNIEEQLKSSPEGLEILTNLTTELEKINLNNLTKGNIDEYKNKLDKIAINYNEALQRFNTETEQNLLDRIGGLIKAKSNNIMLKQKAIDNPLNTPPTTPVGSRASTANESDKVAPYKDKHSKALQNLRDEEYLRKKDARQNLQNKLQQLRNEKDKKLQEMKEIKESKLQQDIDAINISQDTDTDKENKIKNLKEQYDQAIKDAETQMNAEYKEQLIKLKNEHEISYKELQQKIQLKQELLRKKGDDRRVTRQSGLDVNEEKLRKYIKNITSIVDDYKSDLKEINKEIQNVDKGNFQTSLMDNYTTVDKLKDKMDALKKEKTQIGFKIRRLNQVIKADEKLKTDETDANNKQDIEQKLQKNKQKLKNLMSNKDNKFKKIDDELKILQEQMEALDSDGKKRDIKPRKKEKTPFEIWTEKDGQVESSDLANLFKIYADSSNINKTREQLGNEAAKKRLHARMQKNIQQSNRPGTGDPSKRSTETVTERPYTSHNSRQITPKKHVNNLIETKTEKKISTNDFFKGAEFG